MAPRKQTDLVTTAAACETLGVTRSAVSQWVRAGKLKPALTLPNGYLFDRAVIANLAEARSKGTAPTACARG